MLPTWMPGRNPFAAVNEYLKNCPGNFLDLFQFFCCKAVPGVGGTVLAGVLSDKELKGKG